MAISLLTSGVTGAMSGTSASVNVSVTAGAGNRKLIVGIAMESAATVTELTFNGQDLVALGLEIPLTGIVTDGVSSCIMFEQFESGLPASGTVALTATFSTDVAPGGQGGGRMFFWLIDGARQDQLGEGGSGNILNGGSSTTTFQTDETFVAGDDDRAIFGICYRNDAATSILLTTPASATHADASGFTIGGGGRVNGSRKIGSMGTGTVRPTWTTQATGANRRTGSAAMFNSAAAEANASGAVTLGAVTIEGTLESPRNADGAITLSSVTTDIAAALVGELEGALEFGAVTVAGTLETPRNLSGALELGAVELAGDVEAEDGAALSGAVALGAVAVAGELSSPRNADGAITLSAVTTDIAAQLAGALDGGITLGAVQVAGTIVRGPIELEGAIVLAAALVSGRVRTQFPGSCYLRDAPAGSAELGHANGAFATLLDGPSGTAEIGHA